MSDSITDFRLAIYSTLGYAPAAIEIGRWHRFATNDRPSDKAGYCLLFPDGRAGIFGDHRMGAHSVWHSERHRSSLSRHSHQLDQRRAKAQAILRERYAVNAVRNQKLLAELRPISSEGPVSSYLRGRNLGQQVPACIGEHPGLAYFEDGEWSVWPAMVAPLVSPDGRLLALHRTYLTPDGHKAPVAVVKKLTHTAGPLAGSCIPLHRPHQGVIGIAEGIETAQAAYLASGIPTVAAYCASNLKAYVWPKGVNRLVIFADADRVGVSAALALRSRALRAGLQVACLTPTRPGSDWCDVWAIHNADLEGSTK